MKRQTILIGAGVLTTLALVMAARSSRARPMLQPTGPAPDNTAVLPPPTNTAHARLREALLVAYPGDPDRIAYYEVTAARETGGTFNPELGRGYGDGDWPPGTKVNVDVSDGDDAKRAYERNSKHYADCGWESARYYPGSLGVFQMFPANAMFALRRTAARCADPWLTGDLYTSIGLARGYEARLKSWPAYETSPTWLTIAVGWGRPAMMLDPAKRKAMYNKLVEWAHKLGHETTWIGRTPRDSDETPLELIQRLNIALS